ncbi:MAG: exodeoxyribonuclease VII large subunit [Acidimicrobiaceae bacterium]|nr:exodeoxyribonuclease VII large subunit [Acidimicrobiaceae bacterium]|tara:strand:+ start:3644 stop:5026 length:1383 start_codon:yes stop_codon:yes gene_type:complete
MAFSNGKIIDPTQEKILSVSGLNHMARSLLEGHFSRVSVEGEISNIATPASGHWYLTLKDKNSQLRCAMFSNRNRATLFKPQNGNQVIVHGKLSIYEGRGDYQLIIENMEEAGDGALRRAFEQLKVKLQAEGLFAKENKQVIKPHYNHIAVISSATGAAFQDILSVFKRRFPAIRVTLFPAPVQGSKAPDELIKAITLANKHRQKLGIQALIIGRGGGSLEDLQAFNDEGVARAIFSSELPITAAVGHEIDFTIADFVADLRAPTPSAAAEQMSPNQQDYFESLDTYITDLELLLRHKITDLEKQANWFSSQLKSPNRKLQEHAQQLDRLENQMRLAINNKIIIRRSKFDIVAKSLFALSPRNQVAQKLETLKNINLLLKTSMRNSLQKTNVMLGSLARNLSSVSPLNTLERGYSITYDLQLKPIRSTKGVSIGDTIRSNVYKGTIESTVSKIQHDESED